MSNYAGKVHYTHFQTWDNLGTSLSSGRDSPLLGKCWHFGNYTQPIPGVLLEVTKGPKYPRIDGLAQEIPEGHLFRLTT